MADLGVESGAAMIEQFGLQGSMQKIAAAAESTGTPLQAYLGRAEAMTLVLGAAGAQSDQLREKTAMLGDAAGATDAAHREQTEGVNAAAFAMTVARREMTVMAQRLGDALAPALMSAMEAAQPLLGALERLIDWFTNLPAPMQKTIIGVLAVVAAIGPLLVIAGTLISAIGSIIGIFGGAAGGAGLIATLGAVLVPIAIAVAAIATIAAIGYVVYRNWDTIAAWFAALWEKMKVGAQQIADAILRVWDGLATGARQIGGALQFVWEALVGGARQIGGAMSYLWGAITAGLAQIGGAISRLWNGLVAGAQQILGFFVRIGEGVAAGAGQIVGFFGRLPGQIAGVFSGAGRWLYNAGQSILMGLWEGLASMGQWIYDRVMDLVRRIIPGPVLRVLGIASPSKLMASYGRDTMRGLGVGIDEQAGSVAARMSRAAEQVARAARDGMDVGTLRFGASAQVMDAIAGPLSADVGGTAGTPTTHVTEVNGPIYVQGYLDPSDPLSARRVAENLREQIRLLDREDA